MPDNQNLISHKDSFHIKDLGTSLSLDNTYQALFKQVTKLDKDNLIVNGNCKFCTHPIRHEAEKKWEEFHGSYVPVRKMFEDWEKEHPEYPTMNTQNIRNHITQHYAKQEQKLWLQEYANSCQEYMNVKISQDRRFEMLRVIMEKQLLEIASNPTIDISRKADQMVKLGNMLLSIEECQGKLRGDIKPINIITERFTNVWLHLINSEQDDSVKHKLMGALDQFQEHTQDTIEATRE